MSEESSVIEIKWDPSARELRQFGRYWFPLLWIVVGSVAWWKYHAHTVGAVVWGVGLALSVAGMVFPQLIRFLFVGISVVTFPLGWVISHLLLGLIFYGVVTPIGFIVRLCGHDALQRKFDPEAKSYWVPHKPVSGSKRYFQQY